jgi:hypothetical protein
MVLLHRFRTARAMSILQRIVQAPRAIASRVRERVASVGEQLTTAAGRERLFLACIGPVAVVVLVAYALWPTFARLDRYGIHDWDAHSAYREITTISLLRYGQAPLWTPYFCGGYPSWAYVEGSTNFVSPSLFFYLIAPFSVALRLELTATTLLLATGLYLLAGRFTKSPALRVLAVAIGAMNGRWSLQTAAGHTWHSQYAWVPLALFLYDVAITEKKRWYAVGCGVVLAEMVYLGAIYPLPHAVVILFVYGALHAVLRRTLAPITSLAIAGATALGLSAPKLLPLAIFMKDTPRLIESTEELSFRQLITMLVSTHDDLLKPDPIPVPVWPWHEYGIYVGWAGVGLLLLGLLVGSGRRTVIVKITAVVLVLLGCGAFHDRAPWTLLHKLPMFSSQHVPTRFLYPGVMLLSVALAAGFAGAATRLRARFGGWIEALLFIPVALVAYNVIHTPRALIEHTFLKVAPPVAFDPVFHHAAKADAYHYTDNNFPEQGPTMLVSMMDNVGILDCYGVPPVRFAGAIAKGDRRYRGEAYVVGAGESRLVSWSPNKAVVDYWNLESGSAVVFNMNYEESWRADGEPAEPVHLAVGARRNGNGRVVFRYVPRGLKLGLAMFALTVSALGAAAYVGRRRRRRARSEAADRMRSQS